MRSVLSQKSSSQVSLRVESRKQDLRRSRWLAVLAFGVPLFVYLAPWRYEGGGDSVPAELLPISILTDGDLDFNEFVSKEKDLPYWFRSVNGRVVSAFPIMAGLLNLPMYFGARLLGMDIYVRREVLSLLTASGLAALSVLFVFLCLRQLGHSRGQALFFAWVYAFATCVWSVASRVLLQHTPSLFFLTGAISLLLCQNQAKRATSGALLSLAVLSRPTNVFVVAPLALFAWRRQPKNAPGLLVSALLPVLPFILYFWLYLGTPLSLGQPFPSFGFSGNPFVGLAGLLVNPSHGLLIFTPIFLFSVVGTWIACRRPDRSIYPYLAAGAVLQILVYSRWSGWWGGPGFGYRYLLEAVPGLILLVALAWSELLQKSIRWRTVFLVLLGFSAYVQFLGAFVYPSEFSGNLDLELGRLWDVRESELVLCTKKLFGKSSPRPPVEEIARVWWTPEKDDDTIPGWLDSSPGGKLVQGPLEITGWAKSVSGDVDVRVVLDNRIGVPERFPRPDVARVVPELGDTSRAGFRATFQPPTGAPSDHRFVVEFRDSRGGVRRLGPVRFQWTR